MGNQPLQQPSGQDRAQSKGRTKISTGDSGRVKRDPKYKFDSQVDEQFKVLEPYLAKFGSGVDSHLQEHWDRTTDLIHDQAYLTMACQSWQKNSFGLFNYNNQEQDMIKSNFVVSNQDTMLLRHEKVIELEEKKDQSSSRRSKKQKKILVMLTAKDSPIHIEPDKETMDLAKKEQETSQLCRIQYQPGKKEDGILEGFWIFHKNKINLSKIYTNPEEKLWYVVQKYPKDAYKLSGLKLYKDQIIRMGRIRLRVRDIDYPEVKEVANENKSQKSQSPRSNTKGNKTNISSNRRQSEPEDEFDVQLGDINIEGNVGVDGGIELVQTINADGEGPNHEFQALKLNQTQTKKEHKGAKSVQYLSKNSEFLDQDGEESHLSSISKKSAMVCRICLDYDSYGNVDISDESFNPMISPCNCSGTMGGIHLKCLKQWLERNKTMKVTKGHVQIKFKKLNCELCKQKFPFSVNINNQIVDIIEVEKPKDNFIILETLSSGNQKEEFSKSKTFFILNTEEKSVLQIGRNASCDVRIGDDISVSRVHAQIRKIGNEYFIEDNKSTFGTLVQVQHPIFLSSELFEKTPMVLQSGKTQIQINCKQLTTPTCSSMCQPACMQKKSQQKKTNKGLATFDKKNYFPINFVEQHYLEKDRQSTNLIEKKSKKAAGQKQNIVQAIEEDGDIPDPDKPGDGQLSKRLGSQANLEGQSHRSGGSLHDPNALTNRENFQSQSRAFTTVHPKNGIVDDEEEKKEEPLRLGNEENIGFEGPLPAVAQIGIKEDDDDMEFPDSGRVPPLRGIGREEVKDSEGSTPIRHRENEEDDFDEDFNEGDLDEQPYIQGSSVQPLGTSPNVRAKIAHFTNATEGDTDRKLSRIQKLDARASLKIGLTSDKIQVSEYNQTQQAQAAGMIMHGGSDALRYMPRHSQELETESIQGTQNAVIKYKHTNPQIHNILDSGQDSLQKSKVEGIVSHEGNFLFRSATHNVKMQGLSGMNTGAAAAYEQNNTSEHRLESVIEERAVKPLKEKVDLVEPPEQDEALSNSVKIRFDVDPNQVDKSESKSERSFNLVQLSMRSISQGRQIMPMGNRFSELRESGGPGEFQRLKFNNLLSEEPSQIQPQFSQDPLSTRRNDPPMHLGEFSGVEKTGPNVRPSNPTNSKFEEIKKEE